MRARLEAFVAASEADLAPLVHEALQEAIADYERLKSKSGCLDFLDLLIKARDLVRNNDGVRRELQDRFTHFFIDEFQDTDPIQAEILLLLAADDPSATDWRTTCPLPGKLFLVGDPKQSIYRFRRADVTLYEEVKRRLLATGAELLHLTTSFRAPPSIQTFVNDVFAPAIGADAEASGYVPLERCRPEVLGHATVVALPVPKPYGDYGNITVKRVQISLPGAVGAFIDWLLNESGWTVEEEGRPVPIQPRHIALLFRRFQDFGADVTRPYVRALEARRIPHVLVGGRSFHDREEIIALRNAMTAIEWPDDELKVFATLRGPFFALSDEALLVYRHQLNAGGTLAIRRLNPVLPINREALDPACLEVADALDLLVVPAYGDGPRQGWFEVLDPVLYPRENARRNSTTAPGCPSFGEESVVTRGPRGRRPAAGSVRPGLHMVKLDGAPIVWWDPAVLRLEVEELAPLRHQRILEMDDAGAAEASERSYAAWKSERAALLTKASEPSLSVRTITSHIRTAGYATEASGRGDEPRVDIERLDRADPKRPGGRRFGALVHALLASIDLKANADAIHAAATVHGRMVGATEDEITAAITTIRRALQHPVLRRAAASSVNGLLRRETPVLLRLSDGCLVEGVVDLAFRDDTPGFAGWTVVDFKTDREFEDSSDRYIAQVTIYSKAVGAATNSPTRGVLLVVYLAHEPRDLAQIPGKQVV